MTPKQCRAARAILEWSTDELSHRAKVGEKTVRRFETGWHTLGSRAVPALRKALEDAGIKFIGDSGVHYPPEWNAEKGAAA